MTDTEIAARVAATKYHEMIQSGETLHVTMPSEDGEEKVLIYFDNGKPAWNNPLTPTEIAAIDDALDRLVIRIMHDGVVVWETPRPVDYSRITREIANG